MQRLPRKRQLHCVLVSSDDVATFDQVISSIAKCCVIMQPFLYVHRIKRSGTLLSGSHTGKVSLKEWIQPQMMLSMLSVPGTLASHDTITAAVVARLLSLSSEFECTGATHVTESQLGQFLKSFLMVHIESMIFTPAAISCIKSSMLHSCSCTQSMMPVAINNSSVSWVFQILNLDSRSSQNLNKAGKAA